MQSRDELDFTPRQPTARIPIFCQVCKRNGHVAYRREDDPRYGGGYFVGPTMRLGDYLAGKPRVCSRCSKHADA